MKRIQWNKVTWYSKLLAVIIFVATFWTGFFIGQNYQLGLDQISNPTVSQPQISSRTLMPVQPKETQGNEILDKYGIDLGKKFDLSKITVNAKEYPNWTEICISSLENPLSSCEFQIVAFSQAQWKKFESGNPGVSEDARSNNYLFMYSYPMLASVKFH